MLLLSNLFHDGHRIVFPTQDIVEFYNTMMFVKDEKERSDILSQFLSILFVNKEKEHQKFISSGMGNILIPRSKLTVPVLTSLFVLIVPSLGQVKDSISYTQRIFEALSQLTETLRNHYTYDHPIMKQALSEQLETVTFGLNFMLNLDLPVSEKLDPIQKVNLSLEKIRECNKIAWTQDMKNEIETRINTFWFETDDDGLYNRIQINDNMESNTLMAPVANIFKICGDVDLTEYRAVFSADKAVTRTIRSSDVGPKQVIIKSMIINSIVPDHNAARKFVMKESHYSADKKDWKFLIQGLKDIRVLSDQSVQSARELISRLNELVTTSFKNRFSSQGVGNLKHVANAVVSTTVTKIINLSSSAVFIFLLEKLLSIFMGSSNDSLILITGTLLSVNVVRDLYHSYIHLTGTSYDSVDRFYHFFETVVSAFQLTQTLWFLTNLLTIGETRPIDELFMPFITFSKYISLGKFILLLTQSLMKTEFKTLYHAKIGTEGFNQLLFLFLESNDYMRSNRFQSYFFFVFFFSLEPIQSSFFNGNITKFRQIFYNDEHHRKSTVKLFYGGYEIQLSPGTYKLMKNDLKLVYEEEGSKGVFLINNNRRKLIPDGTYSIQGTKLKKLYV